MSYDHHMGQVRTDLDRIAGERHERSDYHDPEAKFGSSHLTVRETAQRNAARHAALLTASQVSVFPLVIQ
jgi:hypothetical protein